MAEIPLILKLKKQMHKDIASAQDLLVKEIYNIFEKAVIHGGTGIWRCYHGNRFSEDVDVYIPKDLEKINLFFKNLIKYGFVIQKKKVSENSIFSNLLLGRTAVRFEALFKRPMPKGYLKEYEKADGNIISVYTLSPEDFLKEKIQTYIKRLKIRDLYDIFFLLRFISDKKEVSNEIKKLINNFKEPIDESDLKILVIEGIVPNNKEMLEYIKRF